ncbi:hypothetical protein C8R46DRAFT_1024702 [Mycena filopes]|nr:hypothetical protein C8R46DRAFT_1024702 [Mycena filopes]
MVHEFEPPCYAPGSHSLDVHRKTEKELAGDPLVFEGREIFMNCETPEHYDTADTNSWALFIASGNTRKTKLVTSKMGFTCCYKPGNIIAICGKRVAHTIPKFKDRQHISMACFTHQTLWDQANVEVPILRHST